jgi:hypothetical protein
VTTPISRERFFRPTYALAELLKKNVGGYYVERDEYVPFMFRGLVIAADPYGGKLETPNGSPESGSLSQVVRDDQGTELAAYTVKTNVGPRNPKNSLKCRIITNDLDNFSSDDQLRVYWPLFPGTETPSPGELVYVIFEDEGMTHGLWVARVPHNLPGDQVNHILISTQLSQNKASKTSLYEPDEQKDSTGRPISPPDRLTKLFID